MLTRILRFLIVIMLVAVLYNIGRWFEIPMDLGAFVRDLIYYGTIQPNSVRFLLFLFISGFIIFIASNQASEFEGATADPLKPQKIELFTKETPAQIVGAANAAMTNLVLMFIGITIIFFLIVRPFSITIPVRLSFLPPSLSAFLENLLNPNSSSTSIQSSPEAQQPDISATPTFAVPPSREQSWGSIYVKSAPATPPP